MAFLYGVQYLNVGIFCVLVVYICAYASFPSDSRELWWRDALFCGYYSRFAKDSFRPCRSISAIASKNRVKTPRFSSKFHHHAHSREHGAARVRDLAEEVAVIVRRIGHRLALRREIRVDRRHGIGRAVDVLHVEVEVERPLAEVKTPCPHANRVGAPPANAGS